MKRLLSCKVSNPIELLYAKTCLKNLFKSHHATDKVFLELATMELGTNLLKYGSGGYLWFLLLKETLSIASVDYGVGIQNINTAKQKGYSSKEEKSLGLGLSTLCAHEAYQLDIISFSKHNNDAYTGSVCVLFEKASALGAMCSLSFSLYDSHYNGDFFVQKGRYLFFGDVSGHGKKAASAAKEIVNYFYETTFSAVAVAYYFKALHHYIMEKYLRSFVGCIVEMTEKSWSVYGVGNIALLSNQSGKYELLSLPDGIIGETFRHISSLHFDRGSHSHLILMSDGIEVKIALDIVQKMDTVAKESLMIAILHFAGVHDDKTIAILS